MSQQVKRIKRNRESCKILTMNVTEKKALTVEAKTPLSFQPGKIT